MSRLWLHAAGALVTAALAVVAARSQGQDVGAVEVLFIAVLLFALSIAARLTLGGRRTAASATGRATLLAGTSPETLARAAVREERRRLTDDIAASLRSALTSVARDAEVAVSTARSRTPDPTQLGATVSAVRGAALRASGELRRQLGLLREAERDVDDASAATGAAAPLARQPVARTDVALAVGTTVVAVIESVVYPSNEGLPVSIASITVTGTAAALVLWRRTAPVPAVLALAGVFVLGAVIDHPVRGGFWTLVTLGGLLWAVAAAGPRPGSRIRGAVAPTCGLLAIGLICAAAWFRDPDNTPILAVICALAWLGGLLTGVAWHRTTVAEAAAAVRGAELDAARRVAVAAERQAFAREIHDVVSHAVGVIAMQGSAAQVLLPTQPERAVESLAVVADTARSALAELDRLGPDVHAATAASRTMSDVRALVERIQASGTPVRLHLNGPDDAITDAITGGAEVLYRVVQEALTNVVRHAHGASATVEIDCGPDDLRVRVTDDGAPTDPPGTERGYGLVGLAERVSQAGGSLTAGPDPAGRGFLVQARLPHPEAACTMDAS